MGDGRANIHECTGRMRDDLIGDSTLSQEAWTKSDVFMVMRVPTPRAPWGNVLASFPQFRYNFHQGISESSCVLWINTQPQLFRVRFTPVDDVTRIEVCILDVHLRERIWTRQAIGWDIDSETSPHRRVNFRINVAGDVSEDGR